MTLYNLTNVQEATTISQLIIAANEFSAGTSMDYGILIGGFLIAMFIAMLLILKRQNFEETLFVASFVCGIFSIFVRNMGIIPFLFVIVFFSMAAISGMIMYATKKTY